MFHHLAEFCRPLRAEERKFIDARATEDPEIYLKMRDQDAMRMRRCIMYGEWVQHNAKAALKSVDRHGRFGTWWGKHSHKDLDAGAKRYPALRTDEVDYRNARVPERQDHDYYDVSSMKDKHRDEGEKVVDYQDPNRRGRGRTVETQSGGVAVLRAALQWDVVEEEALRNPRKIFGGLDR